MPIRPVDANSSSTKKRAALVIGCLAIVAICLVYFGKSRSDESKKTADSDNPIVTKQDDKLFIPAASPLRKRLQVEPVVSAAPSHSIDIPGVVEADPAATVNIVPPLTGRLTALKVKLGDTVTAGQVLAIIKSPDLAAAYADADKARDTLELAKRALDRGRSVNQAGANATKDMEQINSNYNQALAEYTRAQDRLKTLGVSSDASNTVEGKARVLTIVAPVSGTVTTETVGVGAFINDPTAAIMTISNLDHVWITANVPENQVDAVRLGQDADITLDAYPGQVWHGKVGSVSALLDADSHRIKARFNFKNGDGRLKPNMYANVKLAVAQSAKLMIPTSALLMNNDSITVFVETAPWTFVRRTVAIGNEDGDRVSVVSGLAAGDRIVTRGGVLIND